MLAPTGTGGRRQEAGVFDRLHRVLLVELNTASELAWSRACVDGSHIRAKKRGVPTPDRRRSIGARPPASTTSICDGLGTALKVITTAANVNDATETVTLVDGISPVSGRPGQPRRRPDALLCDKGYDSHPNRDALRERRILPVISRKRPPNIKGFRKLRYIVPGSDSGLRRQADDGVQRERWWRQRRQGARHRRRPHTHHPATPPPGRMDRAHVDPATHHSESPGRKPCGVLRVS
ncbi:transposase [Streptomyces cyaneofuscatus]|uniref:transposase n=1 Tax=Streptomyces cyaneofuscatus TaxID=66883 RepID=UPI003656ECAF